MKIEDQQTDRESLAALGVEAVGLLCAGDFSSLADRFGYVIARGRELVSAIQEDLANSLSELQGSLPRSAKPAIKVVYFKPNDSSLFALVECRVPTQNGREVLVELVVTSGVSAKHITLEQVSAA